MRQRREDVRNFAVIVGSGALGAVAALVGVSLMGSSAEVQDPPAPALEVTEATPSRFRAEISISRTERPLVLYRRMPEARLKHFELVEVNRALMDEVNRTMAEAMARREMVVAQARATNEDGDRSAALEAELQAELRAALAALQARLEGLQTSTRELEGTISGVRILSAGDPGAAPVIYVDGVRFDGAMEDLSAIDIESIDVIKGDAAIEQYGKEGEHGVIIIKKRKPGKKRKGGGPP